ncbi:MAG: Hint domain-containing protein [Sulfitobacter sp.]
MAVYYRYTNAIFGTQSTVNGSAHNYSYAPTTNANWSYSGQATEFTVAEKDGAIYFNGDVDNEEIESKQQIGGQWEQVIEIDGTARQNVYDYTFTVKSGGSTWRVAVIDVDLNNNDTISGSTENGYYLIFPDGLPPANVNLRVTGVVDNSTELLHTDLGAQVVCFASGMMIDTPHGPVAVENLFEGDLVETREFGPQPVRWVGSTSVTATGDLAPIVISAGVFDNSEDLIVSPQHAILITGWRAQLIFGEDEILVRAVDLLRHEGVYRRPGGMVTYHHILLDKHATLCSAGQWSESLYPGDMTLQTVNPAVRDELLALFPQHFNYGPKAARCARKYEAQLLAA